MTSINNMSLTNSKRPIHVPSSNFLVNEIHNIVRLNFGGREVVRNESEIDRRQIDYR